MIHPQIGHYPNFAAAGVEGFIGIPCEYDGILLVIVSSEAAKEPQLGMVIIFLLAEMRVGSPACSLHTARRAD